MAVPPFLSTPSARAPIQCVFEVRLRWLPLYAHLRSESYIPIIHKYKEKKLRNLSANAQRIRRVHRTHALAQGAHSVRIALFGSAAPPKTQSRQLALYVDDHIAHRKTIYKGI